MYAMSGKQKLTPVNRRHHCRKCGFWSSVGPALKRDFFFPASPLSLYGFVTSAMTCFLLGTWPHASLLDRTLTVSH
uniref:Putative pleckstrin logy domain protein n=1 Tax=Ixodes ricinus TaxID=34613 RepID=A0A0K8RKR4_IXORI